MQKLYITEKMTERTQFSYEDGVDTANGADNFLRDANSRKLAQQIQLMGFDLGAEERIFSLEMLDALEREAKN